MLRVLAAVAVLILIAAILVFGPVITIWSLNTLIGSSIPINLATWFAVLWLGTFFTVGSRRSKS